MNPSTGLGPSGDVNPSIAQLLERIHSGEPKLGRLRLVLIDGPAASGKSTLANRLAVVLGGEPSPGCGTFEPSPEANEPRPVQILHGDDMYAGWDGLPTVGAILIGDVLEPLSRGEDAGFRMWDWGCDVRRHTIPVTATDVLIIEGVGVGQCDARPYANLVVYVDAPKDVRLERGVARDGERLRDRWIQWQEEEEEHFFDNETRKAAAAIVDGTQPVPD